MYTNYIAMFITNSYINPSPVPACRISTAPYQRYMPAPPLNQRLEERPLKYFLVQNLKS